MVMRVAALGGLVRGEAFRPLLATGEPAAGDDLAASIGLPADKVARVLDELKISGLIRCDEAGRVVGSAGLSVVPDRHQIDFEGRGFWTWCAYDILGIFGALRAMGSAVSRSPVAAAPITLRFREGRPEAAGVVLFRPSDSLAASCSSIYEEWCPNSNFFEDAESARTWSAIHGLEGRILSLDEASDLATAEWLPVTRPPRRRSPERGGGMKIELLHVPDGPHVDAARALLDECLADLRLDVAVEDTEGEYPSPTIL